MSSVYFTVDQNAKLVSVQYLEIHFTHNLHTSQVVFTYCTIVFLLFFKGSRSKDKVTVVWDAKMVFAQ